MTMEKLDKPSQELEIARQVFDAERELWPHEPGVERDLAARPLLQRLQEAIDNLPFEVVKTPADIGRHLGARVVLAKLTHPRRGWTWFRKEGPLIEVADWLTREEQQLAIAHEVCHLLLGPAPERHHHLTERVCNWGAGVILSRLAKKAD